MRIKSKWHKKGAKTTEEIAQTAAYIIWKIAKSTADKMYMEGFNFDNNRQLLGMIGEFVALMLQSTGQITYESMADEFTKFINTTAKQLAHTMADNLSEESAPSSPEQFADDAKAFVNHLNQRLSDYSEFTFSDDGEPSYPALRFFGKSVEEQMEGSGNKWLSEQVMEVESPIAIKELKKALSNILALQDDESVEST